MITFKNTIIAFLLVLSSTLLYAQEPATLTLVSTKKVEGVDRLTVSLDRHMNATTWEEDYIKFVITVTMNEVSRDVAKALVIDQRYAVRAYSFDGSILKMGMPNLTFPLYINGEEVPELFTCEIFVPVNYSVIYTKEIRPMGTTNNEIIKLGTK